MLVWVNCIGNHDRIILIYRNWLLYVYQVCVIFTGVYTEHHLPIKHEAYVNTVNHSNTIQ